MALEVLARGSAGYEGNRGAFNLLLSQEPAAIVTPQSSGEVIDAIDYAQAEGLRVAAQRTGHAAEPLGDLSDTLLIRTAALGRVSIDAERRIARVGSGALWGDVVTAIEFELLPIAEMFAGAIFFPLTQAPEVLHTWHALTRTAPDELTSLARVMNFPATPEMPEMLRGRSFAIVEAVALLPEAEATELLAPLRGLPGAMMDTFATVPPAGIVDLHMDPAEPSSYAGQGMLLGELPETGIDALLAAVGPGSGSGLLSVEMRHDGGAMGRGAAEHGAMDALPGEFLLFGVNLVETPEALAPSKQWLGAMAEAMAPWDAGRYLNFSDEAEDIAVAFPPETVARLRAAKKTYDPQNLFHANHPVVSA